MVASLPSCFVLKHSWFVLQSSLSQPTSPSYACMSDHFSKRKPSTIEYSWGAHFEDITCNAPHAWSWQCHHSFSYFEVLLRAYLYYLTTSCSLAQKSHIFHVAYIMHIVGLYNLQESAWSMFGLDKHVKLQARSLTRRWFPDLRACQAHFAWDLDPALSFYQPQAPQDGAAVTMSKAPLHVSLQALPYSCQREVLKWWELESDTSMKINTMAITCNKLPETRP